MLLEQTLHGYDDGHRLLATSARLDAEEERQLDLLSDLSGYLPAETDFASYFTGYPCGRFYVVSCTWPDRMGKRSGTVFTHSLLVPRSECAQITDLGSLTPLFRQPSHPVDRSAYGKSQDWTASPSAAGPVLAPQSRRLLAGLWFGQDLRPLLWLESLTALDAARFVWAWLPPWLRDSHTFCTFTLGPRYLGARLFDWMAIARGADGLFYSLRDRSVRCDGQNAPPGMATLLEAPWVAEIADGPPSIAAGIWADARSYGLRELPSKELRVFLRYREFRERSKVNFTAALSRIDLLQRLAPSHEEAADEKRKALLQALSHLRQTPPTERTSSSLLELLDRNPTMFAPSLLADVGGLVAETLEHRMAKEPPGDVARFWQVALKAGFADPVRSGILAGLHRGLDEGLTDFDLTRIAPILLALADGNPEAMVETLRALPVDMRGPLMQALLAEVLPERRGEVAKDLLAASERLSDFTPLLALVQSLSPASVLEVLAKPRGHGISVPADLETRLLDALPLDELLGYLSLPRKGQSISVQIIESVAARLPVDATEAASKLDPLLDSDAGIAILAACAQRNSWFDPEPLLRAHPAAVSFVFGTAQEDPSAKGLDRLIAPALSVVDKKALVDLFDPARADKWQHARWAPQVLEAILACVLDRWLSSHNDRERLRRWLAAAPSQQWLRREGAYQWRHLPNTRHQAALYAIELLAEPATQALRHDDHLLGRCLEAWSDQSVSDIRPMIPAWLRVLESIEDSGVHAKMCTITLNAVLRRGKPDLVPLVEATFATVHRELLAESRHGWLVRRLMSLLSDENWDRAGELREKLAREWVKEDWPPLSLLKVASGDLVVFEDLAHRAREYSGGKKALRRLWHAAQKTEAPDPAWRDMLERLPRYVDVT